MTDLEAIRERAEDTRRINGDPPLKLVHRWNIVAGEHARDVIDLLDLIEKPDEAAVERATDALVNKHINLNGDRIGGWFARNELRLAAKACLRAAYTEENRG